MPSRNYSIIDARAEHAPFLAGIERVCARVFPPGVVPEHLLDVTHPETMFAEAIAGGRVALAVKKGLAEPVGFAMLEILDGLALLAEVDVLPEHGRRGVGKALVLRAVEMAGREGYGHLYLTTFRNVQWNYPFYRRLGFAHIPEDRLPPPMARLLDEEKRLGYFHRVVMRLPTAADRGEAGENAAVFR